MVLSANRFSLASSRVAVWTEQERGDNPVVKGDARALANNILRSELRTMARISGEAGIDGFFANRRKSGKMQRFFDRCNTNSFIISAQDLSLCRTTSEKARIEKVFADFDGETIPVLCTRSRPQWQSHREQQIAKAMETKGGLARAQGGLSILDDWAYDLDAIRAFWSQFGQIREIDFDHEVALQKTPVPALLNALDLSHLVDQQAFATAAQ